MPLSEIQTGILRLLASHRNPESYVAGSTPLTRSTTRYSSDIDIFHDREERVAQAAQEDSTFLEENGYTLKWLRREPLIYALLARKSGQATKVEWVADSDFRFFPTVPDETFGYILHPADLATNKVAAAYGRREPRDIVDLLAIHDGILPLGARYGLPPARRSASRRRASLTRFDAPRATRRKTSAALRAIRQSIQMQP